MNQKQIRARVGVVMMAFAVLAACSSKHASIAVTVVDNPAPAGASLPNLARSPEGVILNWVRLEPRLESSEREADKKTSPKTHSLRMSRFNTNTLWAPTITIAKGRNWFINWADFPSVYAMDDGRLAAHWLRRSGQSTYAYDVVTSQSQDGLVWSAPEVPHQDGTKTEHGFVSFFTRDNLPALTWLDGRNTGPSDGDHAHAEGGDAGKAMTLRTGTLSAEPNQLRSMNESKLIDERVCDCCQTTAVNTDEGAVVFYRNRSETEIRDIAYVRYDRSTDSWSAPALVFNDGWEIAGCPVNGPQADARGRFVAVAWFTAAPTPRVQVAISGDSGKTFGPPALLSKSAPLGRVSLAVLDTGRILVTWLEQESDQFATLKAQLLDTDLDQLAEADIASVSAARRSGFPRLAALDDQTAMIAWTELNGELSTIRTALIEVR